MFFSFYSYGPLSHNILPVAQIDLTPNFFTQIVDVYINQRHMSKTHRKQQQQRAQKERNHRNKERFLVFACMSSHTNEAVRSRQKQKHHWTGWVGYIQENNEIVEYNCVSSCVSYVCMLVHVYLITSHRYYYIIVRIVYKMYYSAQWTNRDMWHGAIAMVVQTNSTIVKRYS